MRTKNEFQFFLSDVNRACGRVVRTLIEYDENVERLRVALWTRFERRRQKSLWISFANRSACKSQPCVRRARLYVVPTFAGTLT